MYANNLLAKFNFDNYKPVSTPADVRCSLEKATSNDDLCNSTQYQCAVGSLMYLNSTRTRTRPDITFAVGNVARYCSKPTNKHYSAVKRIFRYLKGTLRFGMVYEKQNSSNFAGYADADWAGDINDRKSTSGYCFKYGSGLISWRSNKQSCFALSTAEAEYVALAAAAQESVLLKQLFIDLNLNIDNPLILYEDNQSAICLASNSKDHAKTKHIAIKCHFLRNLVNNNEVILKYCPSNLMIEDLLTKALPSERFVELRPMLEMTCK